MRKVALAPHLEKRFIPLNHLPSPLWTMVALLANAVAAVSPTTYWEPRYARSRGLTEVPKELIDRWILTILLLEVVTLLVFPWVPRSLLVGVAVFSLIECAAGWSRDFLGAWVAYGKLSIRNPLRWFLISGVNLLQVVCAFALLSLSFGACFESPIQTRMTAVYFSLVTFTTLGFGDIKPICPAGELLVILELTFFLMFLAVKAPVAVSLVEVESGRSN